MAQKSAPTIKTTSVTVTDSAPAAYKGIVSPTAQDQAAAKQAAPDMSNASAKELNGMVVGADVAAYTLAKPAAGKTTVINAQGGDVLAAQFDPDTADLSIRGKDLVIGFQDGSKIVVNDFAADAQNMPSIALPNGALVAGGVIIAQLQGTNAELFNLETAAGGAPAGAGGQFTYDDNMGNVIDLLNKLPPIPFTELRFPQPEPELRNADETVGGTFIPRFDTVDGQFGPVQGGFEDWKQDKHIGDFTTETPMQLNIAFTPEDNEVIDQLTISNIPTGVQFFYSTDGGATLQPLTITNGSITLSGQQYATYKIYALQSDLSDIDIPMTISMLIRDPDNGKTAVITANTVAIIDAVADQPQDILNSSVSVGNNTANHQVTGNVGEAVELNLNVNFPDNDGSETHTISLEGVPAGWTMNVDPDSDIVWTKVDNGDGTFDYNATVTGNVSETISFNTHNNDSSVTDLVFRARTEEKVATDLELTTENNVSEVATEFSIIIQDDTPKLTATAIPVALPEDLLMIAGVDSTQGDIKVDFYDDGPGSVVMTLDGLQALGLTSHGQTISYALSQDGQTITATINNGTITVFTFQLGTLANTNVGTEQAMKYTFTLLQPLDHAPGAGANNINIPVKIIAKDADGDTVSGQIGATVKDDLPSAGADDAARDETSDLGIAVSGSVATAYGADGAGSTTINNQFNASGQIAGGVLKSGGEIVNVTFANNQYVGKVGNTVVFTLTLNANGNYTFTQFKPLDHSNINSHDETITLKFGYSVTDYDGDVASNTITIDVKDDGPTAHDDHNSIPDGSDTATGNVITGLNGGPGAADDLSTDTVNLLQDASANGVTKYFATPDGTDAGGKFVTLQGDYGTLKIYENGEYEYTYDAAAHGPNYDKFDLPPNSLTFPVLKEGQDIDDVYTDAQQQVLIDTANSMVIDFPTIVTVTLQKSTIDVGSYNNSLGAFTLHSNGTISNVDLFFGNATADVTNPLAGQSVNYEMSSGDGQVVFFLVQNAFNELKALGLADAQGRATDLAGSLSMQKQPDGSLKLVYTDSSNVQHVLTSKVYTSEQEFNADGQFHTIAGLAPNTLDTAMFGFEDLTGSGSNGSDRDFNDVMFTVTVDDRYRPGGKMNDEFTYTLKDKDGDTSKANLDFDITDNGPGNAPNIVESRDETNQLNIPVGGTIIVEDAASYALGAPNGNGTYLVAGSVKGGVLSSNGVAIEIKFENGKYVGKAGSTEVFTLEMTADGKYSFVQKAVIDHANGADANDAINLTFAYTARDADGDAVEGKILINILDDAPTAIVDTGKVLDGQTSVSGNVVTNDLLSKDVVNLLSEVSGKTFTSSDANGNFATVNGNHGVLKIYQNGAYTYTVNANNVGNHQETFNYTLRDKDGDTSSTTLTIDIVDKGPGVAPSVTQTVDETSQLNATITDSVSVVNATTYALGAANGSATFSSNGEKLGGNLTSNGQPITVTIDQSGKYVGKLSNGTEVFSLTMNANGTYSFVQKAVLDHALAGNPDEAINLVFTYTAKDADGDASSGTITVIVKDDAPLTVSDSAKVLDGQTSVSGNVVQNDDLSNDVVNLLSEVDGKTFNLSDANGSYTTVNGNHGVLKIYQNGAYTYTLNANNVGNHTEEFNYTLRDRDGDTSSTTLTIDIVDNGPGVAPSVTQTVDETSQLNATITDSVSVVNATTYALGAANGAGTFSSTGSKLGDALTSNGNVVSVSFANGKYTGTILNGSQEVFSLTMDANGKYYFVQKAVLDHKDASNPNDFINLVFTYTAKDADGDASSGNITVIVKDDAPLTVSDSAKVLDGQTSVSGNVVQNDDLSNDVVNLLSEVSGKTFNLSDANGNYTNVNGNHGVLKIYQNGAYTYTVNANSNGNHQETFNYTLRDKDGDTSSTTLTIDIVDNGPGAAPSVTQVVDETTDINVTMNYAALQVSGATSFALGDVSGNPDFIGALKSHGQNVTVSIDQNGRYVGKLDNGTEIFTLSIANNGTYSFTLKGQLDHANASDPNDIIGLNFTYTAKDADGDAVEGKITINVKDDAPLAAADFYDLGGTTLTATGNVIDNDDKSNDVSNTLKSVGFGSTTKSFDVAGDFQTDGNGKFVTVNGANGTVKIYENGSYSYTLSGGAPLPGNGGTKSDVFNYTLKDYDGDSSSTTLSFQADLPKMIVGTNTDDKSGSTTGYVVGNGSGLITGTSGSDLLVGDKGGASVTQQVKNYNVVMVLDVSGSMAGNKIALLRDAVKNLMTNFNAYNGGSVKVHIVPFATTTGTVGTFDLSTSAGFNAAMAFVGALQAATGDYQYTNFEAPMQSALTWLNSGNPISGATNFTYFVSDGDPNRYMGGSNGTTITAGSADQSMDQIRGTDGTNEVAQLQAKGEVVAVGIGVNDTTIARLDLVDSNGDALNVQNPADLSDALQGASPISAVGEVGDDVITGGDSADLLYGDVLNTDALAIAEGIALAKGSGWAVFAELEANHGWTRAQTIAYIRTHQEEMARETLDSQGAGRNGGDDDIKGGAGNDVIFGQEGNDVIVGEAGNDILSGGSGNNSITGGLGADTFLFLKSGTDGLDTINDYSRAQNDVLDISDLLVGSSYTPGTSVVANYVKIDDGQVFVDATGSGSFGASNHVATLNGLGASDLVNIILNDAEGNKIISNS